MVFLNPIGLTVAKTPYIVWPLASNALNYESIEPYKIVITAKPLDKNPEAEPGLPAAEV